MSVKPNTSFTNMGTYLRVSFRGEWNSEGLLETALRIKEKADQTNHTRILIDCFGLTPPRTEIDRIYAGMDIASMLTSPLRVAALSPSDFITHLAESVALNRKALFRIFGQENEAIEWLLSETLADADD